MTSIRKSTITTLLLFAIVALAPLRVSIVPPVLGRISTNFVIVGLVGVITLFNARLRTIQIPILMALMPLLAASIGQNQISAGAVNSAAMILCIYFLFSLKLRHLNANLFGKLTLWYGLVMTIAAVWADHLRLMGTPLVDMPRSEYEGTTYFVGLFFNPNQSGIFAAALMLLTLISAPNGIFKALILVLNGWLIVQTECRSALVGLVVGIVIYGLAPVLGARPGLRQRVVGLVGRVALPIVVLGSISAALFLSQKLQNKIESAGFNSRIRMWRAVWGSFSQMGPMSWLFGAGPVSTKVTIAGEFGHGLSTHNSYLQVICDYGILVLVVCLVQIALAIRSVPSKRRGLFLTVCIPALLVGIVEVQIFSDASFLWLAVIAAFHLSCANPKAFKQYSPSYLSRLLAVADYGVGGRAGLESADKSL